MAEKTPTADDAAQHLRNARDAYAAIYAADTERIEYLNVLSQITSAMQQAAQAQVNRPR